MKKHATQSLGPSNDDAPGIWIEIKLAGLLAENVFLFRKRSDRDINDESVLEVASEQVVRVPGPRSPIAMMVDRACGVTP